MEFAVGMLDASTGLLQGLGDKEALFSAKDGIKPGYANGEPEAEAQARVAQGGNYSQSQPSQDQFMTDAPHPPRGSSDSTFTCPRQLSHNDAEMYSETMDQFSNDRQSNVSGLASPSTSTSSGSGAYEVYMVPPSGGFPPVGGGGGEDCFNYPGTGAGPGSGTGAEGRGWMGGGGGEEDGDTGELRTGEQFDAS